jgi:hypothetical protein
MIIDYTWTFQVGAHAFILDYTWTFRVGAAAFLRGFSAWPRHTGAPDLSAGTWRNPRLRVGLTGSLKVQSGLRARICKHFKEPRNRFPAWRAGTTTLFVAGGIDSSESISGLLKCLQVRALALTMQVKSKKVL